MIEFIPPPDHVRSTKPLKYIPCGAKLRGQPGLFCRNRPEKGRNRCKFHGGRFKRGPESHRWKQGVRKGAAPSRFKRIPEQLAERMEEADKDPKLLGFRRDITLLEARIVELVGRLSTTESGKTWEVALDCWKDIKSAMESLLAAMQAKDQVAVSEKMVSLRSLILDRKSPMNRILLRGNHDEQTWGDISGMVEQKAKMAEREHKRLIDLQQIVTVDQAMMLMGALMASVNRHVTDPDVRRRVGMEFAALSNFSRPERETPIESVMSQVKQLRAMERERQIELESRGDDGSIGVASS